MSKRNIDTLAKILTEKLGEDVSYEEAEALIEANRVPVSSTKNDIIACLKANTDVFLSIQEIMVKLERNDEQLESVRSTMSKDVKGLLGTRLLHLTKQWAGYVGRPGESVYKILDKDQAASVTDFLTSL